MGCWSGEKWKHENRLSLLGDTGCGNLGNINNCVVNLIKNSIQLPATQHLLASVNSNNMAACFDRLFGCRQTSTLHNRQKITSTCNFKFRLKFQSFL